MPEALSDAQWAAIRELVEGGLPTHQRVAHASGVYVKTISRRAGDEKWRTLDFRHKRVGAAHRAMIRLAAEVRAGVELDPDGADEEDVALGDGGAGEADGWAAGPHGDEALPPLPDEDMEDRLARISDLLSRRTLDMLRHAEAGRPLERRQVAALTALTQLAERMAVMARSHAARHQAQEDESRADVLAQIHERIVQLAHEMAREVLGELGVDQAEIDRALPPGLGPEAFVDEEARAEYRALEQGTDAASDAP